MQEATAMAEERNTGITENILKEAAERIKSNGRKPAPAPPKGGISLSAAGRKYKILQQTISRWVSKGYIPVLLRTKREVYVEESALAELVEKYRQDPGQGKKTVRPSE